LIIQNVKKPLELIPQIFLLKIFIPPLTALHNEPHKSIKKRDASGKKKKRAWGIINNNIKRVSEK
jgi:hypothetical protein